MNRQNQRGFTVIEVVLFLAVSGLLGIGILATASSSVNQERYRDSVRSLQAYVQDQYSKVLNTQNDRAGNRYACTASGTIVDTSVSGGGATQSRGASDCYIVGRVVDVLDADRKTLVSQPVYATYDPMQDALLPTSDSQAFDRSRLIIAPSSVSAEEVGRSESTLEWDTAIVSESGGPRMFRLLIVRSPYSGMIRTYAEVAENLPATSTASVRALAVGNRQTDVTLCVDPAGLFTGQDLGVQIARGATSSAGVTLLDGGAC